MLRRVMDSGARGCEIIISGKLTGPRSRTEKFISGYIKHSGKPADDIVDKGYSIAIKKLGVIGCQVRIIPPDTRPPDQFQIVPPQAPPEPQEKPAEAAVIAPIAPETAPAPASTETKPEKKSELDQLLEAEPAASAEPAAENAVVEEPSAAEETTTESKPSEESEESKPTE